MDDDPAIVDLVTTYLDEFDDIRTDGETDPAAAVERVREDPVECVVSDFQMPGMDGLELLSAVREIDPDVPFILFTGRGSESVASEAVSAGVTDYIRKSTSTDQYHLLANRVRNAVESRRARTNYREVFDAASDAILIVDPESGTIVDANRATERLWGYDVAALESRPIEDLLVDVTRVRGAVPTDGGRAETVDVRCVRADGDRFWAEASLESGTFEGHDHRLAVFRDVTERRGRERAIDRLVAGQQEMLAAESDEALGTTAANVAVDVLSLAAATVYARDGAALATLASAGMPTPAGRESRASRVLGGNEPVLETTDNWRELHVPVGDRGVIVGVAARTRSFATHDHSLAMALGNSLDTALERVERERQLRDRGERLARRRDELRTTDRINAVIRNVHWSLVRASSRDEIERLVCERLAASDPYSSVWIGRYDVDAEELLPTAAAGLAAPPAESVVLADAPPSLSAAIADRTTEIVHDTSLESDAERIGLRESDHRSIAYVPIVNRSSLYGVVAIAADEPDVFGDGEREVLGELGELIGAAITATRRERALFSDDAVELEFEVTSGDSVVGDLSTAVDDRVDVESVLETGQDALSMFVTVPGIDAERVDEVGAEHASVRSIDPVDERRGRYEIVVDRASLIDDLTDQGASMGRMWAEAGRVRFAIEFPADVDVRRCVALMESAYESTSLVARRELSGEAAKTRFGSAIPDDLTDRQREVLRVAHETGFFEWPRARTGEEVAERLDISQSTFTEHLRSGERKVFEALFGDSN